MDVAGEQCLTCPRRENTGKESIDSLRLRPDDEHLAMLRIHNTIVRQELESHGGREVKHTGDGIMAAFISVASAVAFAIATSGHSVITTKAVRLLLM
jgi:class 3 adenylate cyclase